MTGGAPVPRTEVATAVRGRRRKPTQSDGSARSLSLRPGWTELPIPPDVLRKRKTIRVGPLAGLLRGFVTAHIFSKPLRSSLLPRGRAFLSGRGCPAQPPARQSLQPPARYWWESSSGKVKCGIDRQPLCLRPALPSERTVSPWRG